MNGEPADIDPDHSARLTTAVQQLITRDPARVNAALRGDREALIGLLRVATDVTLPSRPGGKVDRVATTAHRLADGIGDCYSDDRPPSGRLCDLSFTLADQVEALSAELMYRRAQEGVPDDLEGGQRRSSPAVEARHLARAHVSALRSAAEEHRTLTSADVAAAEYLYRAVVDLGRAHTRRSATISMGDTAARSAAPKRERGG